MKIPPIPDKLFFKIGEVADLTSVEQHVLRYWEDEIESLKPKKNKSGQRLYQKRDVELILISSNYCMQKSSQLPVPERN